MLCCFLLFWSMGVSCTGGSVEPGSSDAQTSEQPAESGNPAKRFVAVTFNTGTTTGLKHDGPPDDGYTPKHAERSDKHYGDGLAWKKAIEAAKTFFEKLRPDVVVFQEIFYSEECKNIPKEAHKDFVCETWKAGEPTVVQVILGKDYQVMCHPGKPDKCAAVKKSFGAFQGCKKDFCLEGLTGFPVKDCGSGARVARGVIQVTQERGGGSITLVNVHGSSGLKSDDVECRAKQVEQVFTDLGDGKPGANGSRNLIMGDLNTDPGRASDKATARWNHFVGPSKTFRFITDMGKDAQPTYSSLLNIDHIISDIKGGSGDCWAAGVTQGKPDILNAVYFDHKPIVCTIERP